MTPATATIVSDLCIKCGICCSGELFDHANLRPGEAAILEPEGFAVGTTSDEPHGTVREIFHLPCQHLAGSLCSRYELGRPAVCSSFFCKLAGALANGDVTEAEAHQHVTQTKAKLAALRPFMKADETWPQMRQRWRDSEAAPSGGADEARFRVMMTALNIWLNRHFRKNKAKQPPMF